VVVDITVDDTTGFKSSKPLCMAAVHAKVPSWLEDMKKLKRRPSMKKGTCSNNLKKRYQRRRFNWQFWEDMEMKGGGFYSDDDDDDDKDPITFKERWWRPREKIRVVKRPFWWNEIMYGDHPTLLELEELNRSSRTALQNHIVNEDQLKD
jgi:hypothetical protein